MGSDESDEGDEDDFSLLTPRLRLRPPRLADAEAVAAIANDWAVARNLARMPHPYALADALDFIPRARAAQPPGRALFITGRAAGELMGGCSLDPREADGEYEIGYWLGRRYWGHGFATEAVHALVDHAFADAGLGRLFVSCRVTNAASRRVIHKSGFQPDGNDMIASLALGGSVPVECYSLDRATWRALREWRREDSYAVS